jgi:hypothetical protein
MDQIFLRVSELPMRISAIAGIELALYLTVSVFLLPCDAPADLKEIGLLRKRSVVSRIFAAVTWIALIGTALALVLRRRGSNSQQAKD